MYNPFNIINICVENIYVYQEKNFHLFLILSREYTYICIFYVRVGRTNLKIFILFKCKYLAASSEQIRRYCSPREYTHHSVLEKFFVFGCFENLKSEVLKKQNSSDKINRNVCFNSRKIVCMCLPQSFTMKTVSRHFGQDKPGKLRGTRHKGRNNALKSSQSRWTGQYTKCIQFRQSRWTGQYTKCVQSRQSRWTGQYTKCVQSRQSRWTGQYTKCVQYDFKFNSVHSDVESVN